MKLSDTQTMLLSKASQHPQGLVAPPTCPPAPRVQIARKLREEGLIEFVDLAPGEHPSFAWGRDTDGKAYAFRITAAGLRAIGVDPEDSTAADDAVQHHTPEQTEAPGPLEAAAEAVIGETAVGDPQEAPVPATPADKRAAEREAKRAARAADLKKREAEGEAEASADAAPRKRKAQAEAEAAADRGELPEPPDFTAATHAPYRKRLEKLVEMAKAGDAGGLRGVVINPTSTSPRALIRYRDLCVRAIEAKAKEAA
jgi:hypothetical protein